MVNRNKKSNCKLTTEILSFLALESRKLWSLFKKLILETLKCKNNTFSYQSMINRLDSELCKVCLIELAGWGWIFSDLCRLRGGAAGEGRVAGGLLGRR